MQVVHPGSGMSARGCVPPTPATRATGQTRVSGGGGAAARDAVGTRGGPSLPWCSRASFDLGSAVAWATVAPSWPGAALDGVVTSPPSFLARPRARKPERRSARPLSRTGRCPEPRPESGAPRVLGGFGPALLAGGRPRRPWTRLGYRMVNAGSEAPPEARPAKAGPWARCVRRCHRGIGVGSLRPGAGCAGPRQAPRAAAPTPPPLGDPPAERPVMEPPEGRPRRRRPRPVLPRPGRRTTRRRLAIRVRPTRSPSVRGEACTRRMSSTSARFAPARALSGRPRQA